MQINYIELQTYQQRNGFHEEYNTTTLLMEQKSFGLQSVRIVLENMQKTLTQITNYLVDFPWVSGSQTSTLNHGW